MKRMRIVHLQRIIVVAIFCMLCISCKQVEAKLNTGVIKVTSQKFPSATMVGDTMTWAMFEEEYIPLGREIYLCWDDIGLDVREKTNLTVTITDPNGKKWDDLSWEIYNHHDYDSTFPIVGWHYIKGPGHFLNGVMPEYNGPFSDFNIDTVQEEIGVTFVGYAAITLSETDPTGLYTGTVQVGDEKLTKSWYVTDKPIDIRSHLLDQRVYAGNPATFTASVAGSHLNYQWFYNTADSYEGGTAIEGATDVSYTIDKVTSENNGRYYYCQISNYSADDTYGMVTKYTTRALLTVENKPVATTASETGKVTQPILPVKTLNRKGKLLSIKSTAKRKISVKWKKLKGISGYQINISKDKKFRKSVIRRQYKAKKQTVKIGHLSSRKTYYIRIRPYKNEHSNVIYGKWSKVKKVSVK